MDLEGIIYHQDCRHFRGDVPCKPNKTEGIHCIDCNYYSPTNGIILIIKLGAIGDVIRTTPLIHKINEEYPEAAIWWLTYSPEILPNNIHKILTFSLESILTLKATNFSMIMNLDKDPHACALTDILKAEKKFGFHLHNGKPSPINILSKNKYLTGLFDDVSLANEKSYLQEIFEICGWVFNGEEYLLDFDNTRKWEINNAGKKVVGLNTGCGGRWKSRLWKEEYWIELAKKLAENGFYPMLLGGQQEHEKNIRIAEQSGAFYPGYFSLQDFISLVNQCDLIVTGVTMALHLAIGLKKKVVLFNNIFNPKEFELYGRGEIIQPQKPCKCYFSPDCKNDEYFFMDSLSPDAIIKAIYNNI